jgi:hypothetical protein
MRIWIRGQHNQPDWLEPTEKINTENYGAALFHIEEQMTDVFNAV